VPADLAPDMVVGKKVVQSIFTARLLRPQPS
jgi:hypothetical protein